MAAVSFGVEHIPELQEDEKSKEYRHLVTTETTRATTEVEHGAYKCSEVEARQVSEVVVLEVLHEPK